MTDRLIIVNLINVIGLTNNMDQKDKKTMFISVAELAKMLGISRVAVFKKIQKGQIVAQKVGRSYVIAREEADTILHGTKSRVLTQEGKEEIEKAVEKVVDEYGETLKLLGKE